MFYTLLVWEFQMFVFLCVQRQNFQPNNWWVNKIMCKIFQIFQTDVILKMLVRLKILQPNLFKVTGSRYDPYLKFELNSSQWDQ